MTVVPGLLENPRVRLKYGHVNPEENRVPHSLGLHFLAIFEDGEILTIRRGHDVDYWPGAWSFSGEEQCAPVDLEGKPDERMRQYLLRTVAEEAFPLGTKPNRSRLKDLLPRIEHKVHSMRVWSLFLEEPEVNFVLYAIFEMKLKTREYAEYVENLVAAGFGLSSPEGHYFTASLNNIPILLSGLPIPAKPLFGTQMAHVLPTDLHPTSRYRLFRLLQVLQKG